ncbi:MAG TPA: ATP-binding protein [Candidatus Acidoferrales bacterium]|jgi:signal transduction histidine kinase|nr:ATP-binding protein [Candidatus Acidoferrales bacterium]
MLDRKKSPIGWFDVLILLLLASLAALPAEDELHKQLILLVIAVFQILEGPMIARMPGRGRAYSVLLKIALATLLLDHTGDVGINSAYYPIYYLPVLTAAIYFGPLATLAWTALSSLAYCSFLIPALREYEIGKEGATILAIRILFFFLAAMLVNRFVMDNRRQVQLYRELSERLEETNRQLQRAEADARRSERLAALGQLSAGLAHEIRNPLGVIKGSAEMLQQKLQATEPLAGELAGYISTEVNRLNALVARFLDFARPSHLDLHPQRVCEIIDRSLESVLAQTPNSKVRVERRYSAVPEVLADEQLCERIFVNLIQNAYQAMDNSPDGHDEILSISVAPDMSAGRPGVAIAIDDTGPGVPPEAREQIFNPFFTTKKEGVGLGLAIVAKIVDDHRGSIKLENDSRPGAHFRIFLPAAPANS